MPAHNADAPCLGVLFVHGAGAHAKGGTLLNHAGPLASWLDRWFSEGDVTRDGVRHGETRLLDTEGSNEPAHALVRFEAEGVTHDWLLAESWWDATFSEPGFKDVLRWALLIAPWMLITQLTIPVVDSFRQDLSAGLSGFLRFLWVLLRSAALTVVGVPLVQLLSVVLLVASILPIPQVRSAIGAVQRLVTSGAGDLYLVLTSPMQRAALATRVRRDIDWLRSVRNASRVVVVAHSQGGFVSYEALSGPWAPNVDGLVTYGSGLVRLVEAERVARRGFLLPVALTASLGILGAVRYLIPSAAAYFGFGRMSDADTIPTIASALFFTIGILLPVLYVSGRGSEPKIAPLETVTRWDDYLSTHDPVLRGSMRDWLPEQAKAHTVHNSGSSLSDHSAYWHNADEFVTQVVGDIAVHDGVRLDAFDPVRVERVAVRRRWRERTLRLGTAIVGLSTVVLVAAGLRSANTLGQPLVDQARRAADFLGADLSSRPMQLLLEFSPVPVALALLGLLGFAANRGIALAWTMWTRGETDSFFRREEPGSGAGGQVVILGIAFLFAIGVAVSTFPGQPNRLATVVGVTVVSLPLISVAASAMFGGAFLVAVVASWSRRIREHPIWKWYALWSFGAIPVYLFAGWMIALALAADIRLPLGLLPVLGVLLAAVMTLGAATVGRLTNRLFTNEYERFVAGATRTTAQRVTARLQGHDAWALGATAWSVLLVFVAITGTTKFGEIDIGAAVGIGYAIVWFYLLLGVAAGSALWVRLISVVGCALYAAALVLSVT